MSSPRGLGNDGRPDRSGVRIAAVPMIRDQTDIIEAFIRIARVRRPVRRRPRPRQRPESPG